jgi:TDG/mug DNA glycosylase family protein
VLEYGIGLTDVVKFASGVDRDLDPEHLGALAQTTLHERILAVAPRFLAFTSKRAALAGLGELEGYGEQQRMLGDTRLWVLPSPSGAAVRWWDEAPWRELAEAVKAPLPFAGEGLG